MTTYDYQSPNHLRLVKDVTDSMIASAKAVAADTALTLYRRLDFHPSQSGTCTTHSEPLFDGASRCDKCFEQDEADAEAAAVADLAYGPTNHMLNADHAISEAIGHVKGAARAAEESGDPAWVFTNMSLTLVKGHLESAERLLAEINNGWNDLGDSA